MTVVNGTEFAELPSSVLEVSQRAAPGELPILVQDATRRLGLLDDTLAGWAYRTASPQLASGSSPVMIHSDSPRRPQALQFTLVAV
ncbi:hypothetical protein ACFY7Y_26030 [Streptomyces virginiae]|uniref:hypothetical protein n=1 Tax=Streptomyces virginiae TaxID=1961 RepID=UPI003694E827